MQRPFVIVFASILPALLTSTLAAQQPAPATPVTPATPTAPAIDTKAPAKKAEVPVYDEAADARVQVAAALAKAKQENQRVLIQWGANWCGWCKWLAGTMKTDGKLRRELMYEYQVVHVDVGQFNKHMDLAKELGADFKAIPFLTVLDASGKALVQQNTEPFETKVDGKPGHDAGKILAFLKEHEAKPLVASEVMAAAMATAAKEQKRVFLHFGAPWCGWCHKLENWMARPEIAAVLGKDFVDLKIDNDRMTGAKEIYGAQVKAAGQEEGGIPWFVLLAADGELLAHSTGPKGNTGFPYQPDEIEHFGTMLKAARQNISDDEIALLLKSLDDNRIAEEAKKGKR
jgi:thiol-disulfide isomerase/thioredoxin